MADFDSTNSPLSQNFLASLLSYFRFPLSSSFVSSRYSFSLIMSSFLSKSTIGMGGSDSGGSIELPMMDQEVISIGDWRILAGVPGTTSHPLRRG